MAGDPIDQVIRDTQNALVYALELELVDQVKEMIALANSRTAKRIIAFGDILERDVAGVGSKLLAAHLEIAREAQESTVEAYLVARASLGRNSTAYRLNSRYAGGRLEAVLRSSGFSVATETGILFGNVGLLDAAARQWARLNYGAGGDAGGAGNASFRVRFSNLESAAFGIEEPVRPSFSMPAGYWGGDTRGGGARSGVGVVGGDEFRPTGRTLVTPTRGIRAEHWMDAGVKTIAAEVGPAYLNVYREIWREAKNGGDVGGVEVVQPSGRVKTGFRQG